MLIDNDDCPVPAELIGRLYRSSHHDINGLIAALSPNRRASLATFCYGRAHLREIGLAIAATCELEPLIEAAGRAGTFLFDQSRELPIEDKPRSFTRQTKVSLAKVKHNPAPKLNATALAAVDEEPEPSVPPAVAAAVNPEPQPSLNATILAAVNAEPPPSLNATVLAAVNAEPPPSLNATVLAAVNAEPPPSLNATVAASTRPVTDWSAELA